MNNKLVSVVTPLFNSEKFISLAIQSVLNQTFLDWEMIVVDDCSNDNSKEIVLDFCKKNPRIKYFTTEFPSGSPTLPRNIGIEKANGRFIAFLDSDDIWESNKLETQIKLFEDDSVALVYSNYEKISEVGKTSKRIIIAPENVTYKILLKGNVIACSTCVLDTSKTGKQYFIKQSHEDYIFWLSILKSGYIARNSGFIGSKYRVRSGSVSSNKLKVIFWVYTIFRKNEKLSTVQSIYFTLIALSKSFSKFLK